MRCELTPLLSFDVLLPFRDATCAIVTCAVELTTGPDISSLPVRGAGRQSPHSGDMKNAVTAQFERVLCGSERFDLVWTDGPSPAVAAVLTVRTVLLDGEAIRALGQSLLSAMRPLWDGSSKVYMQIYGSQICNSCFVTALNISDPLKQDAFQTDALAAYRTVLRASPNHHALPSLPPPVMHDVCFLPEGRTVRYEGRP